MNRTRLTIAGLAALAAVVACSDIVSPNRVQRYEWRLIVNYDSAATVFQDTLSFHWPRNRLPVKIWVQDQDDLPARVREGIAVWKNAFLYEEWDATLVTDSNAADVLIHATTPPPALRSGIRMAGMAESCEGATDVDTASTRFELSVPVRSYVFVTVPGAADLEECMRAVATHELGHTMGLFQHSPDSTDLMFTFPSRTFLTDRDLGTIYNAYHLTPDMVPGVR